MSFNASKTNIGFQPGYFLASADCERKTFTIPQESDFVVTLEDGTKYFPAGFPIYDDDENLIGLVYEDVDVTTGDMPGSVVTRGTVYAELLPYQGGD